MAIRDQPCTCRTVIGTRPAATGTCGAALTQTSGKQPAQIGQFG
jgi:hypothetical protein